MASHPSLQVKSPIKEAEENTVFSSLNDLQLLASIQTEVQTFTRKYTLVLDKLEANAEADAKLIALLTEKASKL